MSSPPPEADGNEPPVIPAAAVGMCVHHPNLRAAFVCGICHQLICELCGFTRTDGSRICTQCASSPDGRQADSGPRLALQRHAPPSRVHALKCLQHPNVAAVQVCKGCSGPMCAVCDFLLPGDIHFCPKCVAAPPKRLTGRRKGLVITAYAFALWGTLAMIMVRSGVFHGMLETREGEMTFTAIFALFVQLPALAGAAIAAGCFAPRIRNPASVWGAAVWNGLLLLVHLAFIVIGNLSK
jgi:hypothetical protein